MPRRGEGGYIMETSTNPVRQQGHNPSYQQAPTDSPQLPQTAQELGGNRQKSQHSPGIPRPTEKAQRPEESSNSLRRGYHTVERGERAVKRKYKEKKENRNSVK
ncbi:hypothetical protein BXZ70DRAFT_1080351 [Cristinia sonorae]|uniref:Uncharacterized protein n=1 Tax=Cristinia sonorae TaxID=1940300 RepID=A0A8K0UFJ1_9AGAR|nr:hypothetical protein BXZ70DRAFT_1080351 [Cristinia sonorae]